MVICPRLKIFFLFLLAASAIFLFLPKKIFAQVVINEFLPNPASGENEWVELYNTGSGSVDLTGWILTDEANSDKSLDSSGVISPSGFVVYEYPSGDGWLNNSTGDTVYLKEGVAIKDQYSYSADPGEGVTFGRAPDGTGSWGVCASPTKNGPNNCSPTTATPTPTSTPTSQPTGTYKIKEVKNEDGNTLSSVKVYVDGEYTHHYASETLTFGDGKYCDNDKEVECSFGEHTIRLEKNGYENWEKKITVESGFYDEDDPVMKKTSSDSSTSTPTSTPKSSPTSTKKPTPTKKLSPTPTPSGEILGEEVTPEGEVLSEEDSQESTPSSFNFQNYLPHIFIGIGIIFLAVSGGFILFPKLKEYNIRRRGEDKKIA